MGSRAVFTATLLSALLGVPLGPLDAQEMNAPMDLQVPTLLKVVEFDREFLNRVGDEVVVGVLYQSRLRISAAAVADAQRFIQEEGLDSVRGIPLRFVFLDLSSGDGLEAVSNDGDLDLLYVAPIRAVPIDQITRITRERDLPTMTGVAEFVRDGLGIGVTVQSQRLRIIVNLPACIAEGVDLSSELLKLAEVLR